MRTIKKYSEEDRNNYLRLWQESGLTQHAFCQQNDLVLRTFNTWKNAKYPGKPRKKPEPEGQGFVTVPLNTSKSTKAPANIQIGVGRYQVAVTGAFDTDLLNRVLTVLEARDVH